ncbi:hypothetical protein BV25DRAFT_1960203 [Artomyces pyxidatus]|uniref:Uncharacterized protein n=1 Tax=Artomyces pyxidatus TaxID=48021 RepID=A0ACB8TFV5_9AGAM|nr:hypothetical protein BV25DRAFT_1960203 [Artomyces pyxidatus]
MPPARCEGCIRVPVELTVAMGFDQEGRMKVVDGYKATSGIGMLNGGESKAGGEMENAPARRAVPCRTLPRWEDVDADVGTGEPSVSSAGTVAASADIVTGAAYGERQFPCYPDCGGEWGPMGGAGCCDEGFRRSLAIQLPAILLKDDPDPVRSGDIVRANWSKTMVSTVLILTLLEKLREKDDKNNTDGGVLW